MNNIEFSSTTEPGKSSFGSGCTEAFATGLTSLAGNMNGQCVDSPVGWWPGLCKAGYTRKGKQVSHSR